MSVEDKVRNLGNLISSQVGFSGTAIMDDLEAAILNRQAKAPSQQFSSKLTNSNYLT